MTSPLSPWPSCRRATGHTSLGSRKERALRPFPRGGGRTARHEDGGAGEETDGPGAGPRRPRGRTRSGLCSPGWDRCCQSSRHCRVGICLLGQLGSREAAGPPRTASQGLTPAPHAKPVQPRGLDRRVKCRLKSQLCPCSQPSSASVFLPGKGEETPPLETRSCLARTKAAAGGPRKSHPTHTHTHPYLPSTQTAPSRSAV